MRLTTAAVLAFLSVMAHASIYSAKPAPFGRLLPPGWSVASAIRGGSMGTHGRNMVVVVV